MTKLFSLGDTVMTAAIATTIEETPNFKLEIISALYRHSSGEWGDLSSDDKQLNDMAIKDGSRILSAYETSKGRIWIITDAEDNNGIRNSTTILYPSDY